MIMRQAQSNIDMAASEVNMRGDYAKSLYRQQRMHEIEMAKKFSLSLTCIIFFFI